MCTRTCRHRHSATGLLSTSSSEVVSVLIFSMTILSLWYFYWYVLCLITKRIARGTNNDLFLGHVAVCKMQPVVTDVVWSVCLCMLLTTMSHVKTESQYDGVWWTHFVPIETIYQMGIWILLQEETFLVDILGHAHSRYTQHYSQGQHIWCSLLFGLLPIWGKTLY